MQTRNRRQPQFGRHPVRSTTAPVAGHFGGDVAIAEPPGVLLGIQAEQFLRVHQCGKDHGFILGDQRQVLQVIQESL